MFQPSVVTKLSLDIVVDSRYVRLWSFEAVISNPGSQFPEVAQIEQLPKTS
jgi:hypothetical protein